MKNILVPTDFSENALKALNYAAGLALRSGAGVHVVHAYALLENIFVDKKSMRDVWNEQQKEEKGAALLALQVNFLEQFPNVQIETHLYTGPTEEVLLSYSEEKNIDLLVMGTQGASGLAEVLVGSTTSAIIGKSLIPVLCIPKDYQQGLPDNMLLATRGFERDLNLLKPIMDLVSIFDVPLDVLVFAEDEDSHVEKVEQTMQLDSYVAFLERNYSLARVHAKFVEGEDFEVALDEYCEEYEIDMLCMLTYKRSFWQQFFSPSLTRKVAYHTRIPLLAVPVDKG
jgi:nucleotide-binding universal stress UspA family protein